MSGADETGQDGCMVLFDDVPEEHGYYMFGYWSRSLECVLGFSEPFLVIIYQYSFYFFIFLNFIYLVILFKTLVPLVFQKTSLTVCILSRQNYSVKFPSFVLCGSCSYFDCFV